MNWFDFAYVAAGFTLAGFLLGFGFHALIAGPRDPARDDQDQEPYGDLPNLPERRS